MKLKFSIVICTYNRSKYLQILLNSFFAQTLSKDLYEIIIVDNNSTDNTKTIIENFTKDFQNARYIKESKQGLSHARNRGWKEALGEYVFYIDDDCKLIEGWLEVVLNIINDIKPDVFGGPYTACYDFPKPAWVKDEYWSNYHIWGEKPYWVEDKWFTGACLGIKRSLFAINGGFDPDYGMSGDTIGYAEEGEWQERMRLTNPNTCFYFSPELKIEHHVRREKTSLIWHIKSRIQKGIYYYRSVLKQEDILTIQNKSGFNLLLDLFGRIKSLLITILNFINSLIFKLIFRDREKYPHFQNYWFEIVGLKAGHIFYDIEKIKTFFLNYVRKSKIRIE